MSASALATRATLLQFLRYLLVGALNTGIGLAVIFAAMAWLGLGPFAANALGYAVGFAISFVLNGRFTFGVANASVAMVLRFLAVIGVAYGANLAMVWLLLPHGAAVAQVAGAAVYAGLGFLGSRHFVFGATRRD